MTRPFRFGVQCVLGEDWRARALKLDGMGFDVLLMPDRPWLTSPLPLLSGVAAVTPRISVGTYVFAATLHEPGALIRDCVGMHRVHGDRFEAGLGAGLDSPPEGGRYRRLEAAARGLREVLPDSYLLLAASGQKGLRLAAEVASGVALGLPPLAGADEVRKRLEWLGEAAARVELNMGLSSVGDIELPYQGAGATPAELREAGAVTALWGDADHMAEQLERRWEELGISYWTVPEPFAGALVPVMEKLKTNLAMTGS